MIKTCLIIVFLQLSYDLSHSQWQVVSNQGNEAVSFPSALTGYSTANGITRKTVNGGYNWSSLSGGNLSGIFFISDMTGWIVGYPGYIGRTTNGGSFIQQPTGVVDRLNDVFFINPATGWVVGGDFSLEKIFKTTNGGDNWAAQTSGTANKLFSVYFIDENTGWSVGGPSAPKIIKTTNGGSNWFTQFTSAGTPLYSVMFSGADTGWAVAGYIGGETIIKTTNGGTSWFSQSSGDNRYLRDCYVINSAKAFAVGQGGKLIMTTNGGVNWAVQITGSSVELWSIDFANDTVGYAIGSSVVLKTTNGGITFISEVSSLAPAAYKLHQNYPNPFNPVTKIRFDVTSNVRREKSDMPAGVNLAIFDVLGREVETLVSEKLKPGTYEFEWDGTNYPGGVYYYRLTAGSPEGSGQVYSETKKMVLIK